MANIVKLGVRRRIRMIYMLTSLAMLKNELKALEAEIPCTGAIALEYT